MSICRKIKNLPNKPFTFNHEKLPQRYSNLKQMKDIL